MNQTGRRRYKSRSQGHAVREVIETNIARNARWFKDNTKDIPERLRELRYDEDKRPVTVALPLVTLRKLDFLAMDDDRSRSKEAAVLIEEAISLREDRMDGETRKLYFSWAERA